MTASEVTVDPDGDIAVDAIEFKMDSLVADFRRELERLTIPADISRQRAMHCIGSRRVFACHDKIVRQVHIVPCLIGIADARNTMIAGFHPLRSFEAIGMNRSVIGFVKVAAMELPAVGKLKTRAHRLFTSTSWISDRSILPCSRELCSSR